MTDYKELDMTIHENCIHYPICLVNDYIHNRCGYYFEKPKQGEFKCTECHRTFSKFSNVSFNYCPHCGREVERR